MVRLMNSKTQVVRIDQLSIAGQLGISERYLTEALLNCLDPELVYAMATDLGQPPLLNRRSIERNPMKRDPRSG